MKKNPKEILQHAVWHCLYGSAPEERTPEQGDKDAVNILNRLMLELKAGRK